MKVRYGAPTPYTYWATVLKVVDGDTIDFEWDLGGKIKRTYSVRLKSISAAETHGHGANPDEWPGGDAAKDNLVALLPVGTKVILETSPSTRAWDRYEGTVYVPPALLRSRREHWVCLNDWLVDQQWATTWVEGEERTVPPWPRSVA